MTLYTKLRGTALTLFGLFFFDTYLHGAGGKLPRGTVKKTKSTTVSQSAVSYCGVGLAQTHGSTGVFSKSGRYFYLLRKTQQLTAGRDAKYRYNILQFDLKKNTASTLFASNLPDIDAIIPHGEPIRGFTFVMFEPNSKYCRSGEASYLTVNLLKSTKNNAPKAFKKKNKLTLVQGKAGHFLYDLDRQNLLELDLSSFQLRGIHIKGISKERPLYASKSGSSVFTWSNGSPDLGKKYGLSLYRASSTPIAKLKIKDGDRLMQDKSRFAIAQFYPDENILVIKEMNKWSRTSKSGDFQTKLPQKYKILEAEYKIDIQNHRILIAGGTHRSKREWRKAFLYDYHAGQPFTQLDVKDNLISEMGFSHDKEWTYFILESPQTGTTEGAMLFSTKTGKWSEFALPDPK